eukprot:281961_1
MTGKFGKYDFDKLIDDHKKCKKIISETQDSLLKSTITVKRIQKYLADLKGKDEKQIYNELQLLVHANDDYIKTIAKQIESLFRNIDKIRNYQFLHNATQCFKQMMLIYKEQQDDMKWELIEDDNYKNRQKILFNKDISLCSIHDISKLQSDYKDYLVDLN